VGDSYVVHLNKRFSPPVLEVGAAGYLPRLINPPQEDRTGFDIRLQPGSGPSGTVWFFELVPPGELQLNYRVKMGERKWRSVQLQPFFTINPGRIWSFKLTLKNPCKKPFPSYSYSDERRHSIARGD